MSATERRSDKRVVIPGARVKYRLENGESGSTRLENMCRNSACIKIKQRVLSGQQIELDLIINDNPIISLKAKIVWVLSRGGYEEGSTVGLEFRPFGSGDRENDLEKKQQIDKIMDKFLPSSRDKNQSA
jgi:Tfp pilus assembly protein PilZ